MPVYSAKSGTQYAAPGPLPVPGPKLLYERFTRLLFGGWVIFCCQAPWCLMLSMESMIAISSRRGGGGRQTFPVPLSRRHKKPPCVGADAHIGPLKRTPCKKYVIARAHRARGEQTERCQWQKKRGERVAAVKISSVRREAAQKFWAPQQGHPRPLSPPLGKGG